MRKKLRCPNCGTVIKPGEKSCSVCHQLVVFEEPKEEVIEEENEDSSEEIIEEERANFLKEEFPIGKAVMIGFIVIGLILAIKGIVEYQNVEYCTADDCGFKSLFLAGVGFILMISAAIELARGGKKYKD